MKTLKGWGIVQYSYKEKATKVKVREVVIGKRKPTYQEFSDGEPRSRIIPVTITYNLEHPLLIYSKKGVEYDYAPRSLNA